LDLDLVFVTAGILLQATILALLLGKRAIRSLPVFVAYIAFGLANAIFYLVVSHLAPQARIIAWTGGIFIDNLFYLGVLIEMGKSTLRVNRKDPPEQWLVFLLLIVIGLVIWPAVRLQIPSAYPLAWRISLRVMQLTTILQSAAFGTLIAWSSLIKLRWPDREFRIVTGMGLWTVVSLVALMLHNDGLTGAAHHWVDQMTPAACLLVLLWWIHFLWFEPAQSEKRQDAPVLEVAGSGRGD
jgi:hypothetical protein